MVRLVTSVFGDVSAADVNSIELLMHECYGRLKPPDLVLVDLLLFEKAAAMEAFFSKEHLSIGVSSSRFDESFLALHDAWRGTPRISVCIERIRDVPELVYAEAIRHEVAHSVLHGSLEYYILPVPTALKDAAKQIGLTKNNVIDFLYLISIAVKDFEATQLLYSEGYVEDQVAYVRHLLAPSEMDRAAWACSIGNPLAESICLVGRLNDLGCALPLVENAVFGGLVMECIERSLSYLPEKVCSRILRVTRMLEQLSNLATGEKISMLAKSVVEEILKSTFLGSGN